MKLAEIKERHAKSCFGGGTQRAYEQTHRDRGELLEEVERLEAELAKWRDGYNPRSNSKVAG